MRMRTTPLQLLGWHFLAFVSASAGDIGPLSVWGLWPAAPSFRPCTESSQRAASFHPCQSLKDLSWLRLLPSCSCSAGQTV
jgi:hypothetical protein